VKNKMQDVRDHLVAMMEALADQDVDAEVIARAKVVSELAQTYTNTVKVEIDALRAAGRTDVPSALQVSPPEPMRLIEGGRKA